MGLGFNKAGLYLFLLLLFSLQLTFGIRFVIDREECLSHTVPYDGDTVHTSFVVIKADKSWHYENYGVDLVVKAPFDEQVHDSRNKAEDKFEFVAHTQGLYQFCFYNKSPYHETVDFDLHVAHFPYYEEHAKDDHFNPLMQQIVKLKEALYTIEFEQHWLEGQTVGQALLNEAMSRRVIHKAFFESVALIGVSLLQVYLLRRLFEWKRGNTRV